MVDNVSFLVVAPSSNAYEDEVFTSDYFDVKKYMKSSKKNYFKVWVCSKSGFVRFLGDCSTVEQFNRLVFSDEFTKRTDAVLRSEETLHSTLVLS